MGFWENTQTAEPQSDAAAATPVEKNWAQAVTIADLFVFLLKLTVAGVPIAVVLGLVVFAITHS